MAFGGVVRASVAGRLPGKRGRQHQLALYDGNEAAHQIVWRAMADRQDDDANAGCGYALGGNDALDPDRLFEIA